MQIIYDYTDAGFRVFPLWGVKNGVCQCGIKDCISAGKHPSISHWQQVPVWSEEALESMIEHSITTGFGICVDDHLIIDIDPRNGGDESFKKLCADMDMDLMALSGFTVATGGGGWHLYFTRPQGAFAQSIEKYRGIDFKTNGFVVGCDSIHKNGMKYERDKGFPCDMAQAPDELLELLKRADVTRALVSGQQVDITEKELLEIVMHIQGFDDYDQWVRVGMGVHHATQGAGIEIWDKWSQQSSKYNGDLDAKWHSFGKSAVVVTLGTLIHLAEESGWSRPITFSEDIFIADEISHEIPFDVSHCDPLRPPGFAGKVVTWMNSNSFYLREHLAVISTLTALGNLAGLHWRCDVSGVTTNLLSICISGTGTGKEAIQTCFSEIMQAGGMGATVHGDIKSKQEIMRNLIEHQAACYLTDELGEVLKAITNAQKKGGAAYLEGITGEIMKIYTKANSSVQIGGDLRRELTKQLAARLENDESVKPLYDTLMRTGALPRPFLSLIGYTTIESIESALSVELAKNGFLNRAFIVEEMDTNPKPNKKHSACAFEWPMQALQIAASGDFSASGRVEYYGEPKRVKTQLDALKMLEAVKDWQWHFAELHRASSGYESLVRRAYEFVCKLSLILAVADGGLRTVQHVEWATAYVKRDIDEKIRLIRYAASRDSKSGDTVADGMAARAQSLAKEGIYKTALVQRLARKDVSADKIAQFLDSLIQKGDLRVEGKKVFMNVL